jgi:hypothetical protein
MRWVAYLMSMLVALALVVAVAWNANEARYANCLEAAQASVPEPVVGRYDVDEEMSGDKRREAKAKRVALVRACDQYPW